jgi:hypothetical protein
VFLCVSINEHTSRVIYYICNSQAVPGDAPVRLRSKAVVQLGDCIFYFMLPPITNTSSSSGSGSSGSVNALAAATSTQSALDFKIGVVASFRNYLTHRHTAESRAEVVDHDLKEAEMAE